MNKLISVALFMACPLSAAAAPSITGFSGDISHGASVSIQGGDFSERSLNINSLGVTIDATTVGSQPSKSGFSVGAGGAGNTGVVAASDNYHSGGRSLKCGPYTSYNCGFAIDLSALNAVGPGERAYVTWWVSYDGEDDGQWKMGRFENSISVVDSTQQIAFHHWLTNSGAPPTMIIDPSGGFNNTTYLNRIYFPTENAGWYRMELELTASSADTADGSMIIRKTSAAGVISEYEVTGKTTHSSSYLYNYFFWQNYIGNGITSATIWFDDLYVQTDNMARVELCSGSTWSGRGRCEIQTPTSWGASSITATVNTGSFTTGQTAYVYVVDSAGDANSSGYAVTIGESGGGGTTITCYQDADGDGYGHGVSETVDTCSSGYYIASHFTALTGDTDDNDASVYPGSSSVTGGTLIRAGSMKIGSGATPITVP